MAKIPTTNVPRVFDGFNFVLVRFEANWADEFDVEGFAVMDSDEFLAWIKRVPDQYEFGFGTNQSIEFDSVDDFKRCVTVHAIPREQAQFLFEVFPSARYEYKYVNGNLENHTTIQTCVFGVFPELTADELEELEELD